MNNQNKIKIRYCKSSELAQVVSLTSKAYIIPYRSGAMVNKPHETLEKIKNNIKTGMQILIAEKNSNLVGAVRFSPINSDKLNLSRLAVLPTYRRQGIGAALVNSVLKIAKKQGFKAAGLDVAEEKKLVSFYEKLGFKVVNRKKHQNHYDVFMEKKI